MFESEAELRRIRIALVWIAVFLLFGACGNQDTIIETDSGNSGYETPRPTSFPLEHNHFGVVENGYIKIYEYNESRNEVKLKKEYPDDGLE
ncbi:YmzC family protein [Bacillus sp. C28GYM-DRY-1]|uniref:YmzC family protein n=1 Tax=Bacillus sp. C28GYM-DRY-1 TaxID=3062686 RepID=UPI0026748002|nr:YmzC family protein [Bacillus sp. C28GYM-DRY-1]MDO3659508.1 YmzC family protein [Bacillus sp. C28GYM-DRY-1]